MEKSQLAVKDGKLITPQGVRKMEINQTEYGQRGTDQAPKYIDEKQVSEITGRALQTLCNDRFNGRGIPYIKLSRMVRYSLQDVIEYMESRKIATEA